MALTRILCAIAAAAALAQGAAAQAPAALDALLARAQALGAQGRAADAYAVLAGAEDEHIGEVRFDYALGRAALDAGLPARATLAFTRVLAIDPYHAGALIDSGRAYLALGNYDQARATFDSLLASDPPPLVRAQIEGYLGQARRGLPPQPVLTGYLVASLGASSNVNQSPGQSQVFVPLFNARFDLSEQNVRKSDRFWSVGGGAEVAVPLDRTWSLVGGAELLTRQNFRHAAFDLGGVGARLGVSAASGLNLVRAQWVQARNYVGRDANREVGAFAVEGFRTLGPDDQLLGTGQAGRIRYLPADLRVFDADFVTFGTALVHRTGGSSTLGVGISAGAEKDTGGNPDGDKRQLGVRLSADVPLRPRWSASLGLALQHTGYDQANAAFLVERRDRRADLELSVQHVLDASLSLRLGATATAQDSNIPLYDFDRREIWLMLRRDFR